MPQTGERKLLQINMLSYFYPLFPCESIALFPGYS